MNNQLKKRIYTSVILLLLLISMYYYLYVLIISLIIISIISWIEFNGLIYKIFSKNNVKNKAFRHIFKSISLLYLSFFSYLIFDSMFEKNGSEIFVIYSLLICINSDIGGLIFGKTFKGKKLTKISPNKTISGSIGSFFLSIILIPIFLKNFINFSLDELIIDNPILANGQGPGDYSGTLAVDIPSNALLGQHMMRVKSNYGAYVPDDACEGTEYGETEDYTVNIISSLGIDDLTTNSDLST